jgi:hypothetical protein
MRAEANPHDAGAGRLGIPVDYRDNHKAHEDAPSQCAQLRNKDKRWIRQSTYTGFTLRLR